MKDCSYDCVNYIQWSMKHSQRVMGIMECFNPSYPLSECPYLPDPSIHRIYPDKEPDEIAELRRNEIL